jgi:D-Tyr-tRNA(Tyr) deacylase
MPPQQVSADHCMGLKTCSPRACNDVKLAAEGVALIAQARDVYAAFVERVRQAYVPERVKDGVFAAMMSVDLCNDGPVTISLDSQAR